jgi:hypothetical protein
MFCHPPLAVRSTAGILGGCLLGLLTSGCGGEAVGAISGKVMFEGQPLPEAVVSFVTAQGQVVTGRVHEGAYVVKGVPVGPAKITVRQIVDPFARQPPSSRVKEVPLRYRSADDSGLTYTVVSGPQTHDFELTR